MKEIIFHGVTVVLLAVIFIVGVGCVCAMGAGLSIMLWELCTYIAPKLTLKKAAIAVLIPCATITGIGVLGYLATNIGPEPVAIVLAGMIAIVGAVIFIEYSGRPEPNMKKNKRKRRKFTPEERAKIKVYRGVNKEARDYYDVVTEDYSSPATPADLANNKTS